MGFLRILLAISIVINHTGFPFGYDIIPTKTAIQAFYIISGFYMALILNEKYVSQKNAYNLFITNRFLRIFPLYWFMLLCIIGADFFRCHTTLANCFAFPLGKTILSSILLGGQYAIKNLFLFPTPVYFTPDAYSLDSFIVPYAWTLGIELLFYFVAPFIVRRSIKTIAILLALSLLSRILLFQYNLFQYIKAHQQGMLYFNMWFFPSVLFFFLIGVISYKLYVRLNTAQIPQSVYLLSTIFIVSFTLLFSTLTQLVKSNLNVIAWIYLLSVIICIPLIFNYSKRIKLDYLAGELSYAVYISHSFIIILLPRTIIFPYKDIYPLLIVFLTLLFSLLLWRFIDKPIDAYRQSRLAAIHGSNPKRKKGSSLQPPLYGSIIEAELLSTKIP